jgi:tetratricopeptide (TPR) repeat protein
MSRQLNNLRDSRAHPVNLRDFTNSVDIKRFSRERGNMTPLHQPTNYFKKIYERSNDKIRHTQPTSLAVTFTKNISQKNMQTKRKLSSGCTPPAHQDPAKTHHYSVSIDQHLLKEKFAAAKELYEAGKYERLIPVARHIIRHF